MDLDEQGLQKGSNFVRNLRALVASSTNRSLLVKISSSANLLLLLCGMANVSFAQATLHLATMKPVAEG